MKLYYNIYSKTHIYSSLLWSCYIKEFYRIFKVSTQHTYSLHASLYISTTFSPSVMVINFTHTKNIIPLNITMYFYVNSTTVKYFKECTSCYLSCLYNSDPSTLSTSNPYKLIQARLL